MGRSLPRFCASYPVPVVGLALLFVGTGLTDYLDVLIRERWEDQVSEVLVRTLGEIDSWHVADLQQLHPDAAAWGICRHWDWPQLHLWQDSSPVVEVRP